MIEQHHLSERRACRLVGLSRDADRHPPVPGALNTDVSGKIIELAHVRCRFGDWRIHDLWRPEYPQINPKRIYRLHREVQLAVRRRRKAQASQRRAAAAGGGAHDQRDLEHGLLR